MRETSIHRLTDAFNKGDMAGAAAAYAPADLTILDELPPYVWRGPDAQQAWTGDLMTDVARRGLSSPAVAVGEPVRWEVDGVSAYVIAPAVHGYKQNGVDMQEPSRMTFTLAKAGDGWKITSWTWTGPKPTPTFNLSAKPRPIAVFATSRVILSCAKRDERDITRYRFGAPRHA